MAGKVEDIAVWRGQRTRREFLAHSAGGALLLAVPALGGAALLQRREAGALVDLSEGQRLTLRSLWDAVVPGTWNGVIEDRHPDGTAAPGADQAQVQAWFELAADQLPAPLSFLSQDFLGVWANDLDAWADVFHGWPGDGKPKFWELPLAPSLSEGGRQHKVILMMALFHTETDLQYLAGIALSKIAYYSDLREEATGESKRVGRAYIGFPLPPGARPYTNFTYNRVLGDHDSRLVTTGQRQLTNLP